jgi:hypothetical protein
MLGVDGVLTMVGITIFGIPAAVSAAWLVRRGPDAIGRSVMGYRSDGWPRGIQEEDRDRPWGAAAARRSAAAGDPAVSHVADSASVAAAAMVSPVSAVTRRRR